MRKTETIKVTTIKLWKQILDAYLKSVYYQLSIQNSIYKIGWRCRKIFYRSKTTLKASLNCHVSWDTHVPKIPLFSLYQSPEPWHEEKLFKVALINRTQGGLDLIKTILEEPEIQGAFRLSFQTHHKLVNHGQLDFKIS